MHAWTYIYDRQPLTSSYLIRMQMLKPNMMRHTYETKMILYY
jgi:hypothetical protein